MVKGYIDTPVNPMIQLFSVGGRPVPDNQGSGCLSWIYEGGFVNEKEIQNCSCSLVYAGFGSLYASAK